VIEDQSMVSSRIWKITADPTGCYWPFSAL